jgi:hypothetical protein
MTRNSQRKNNSNRTRKGKARDITLPIPDYTNTFLGAIRSAAGGIHYNIEIMHHNEATNMWKTEPAMATLRGGIRKTFFRKDLPQQLSERIILVEQTELARPTAVTSTTGKLSRKMCMILHCYTIDQIRQLNAEELLPPNLVSYTDSSRVAMGDKVDIGATDDVIIEFDASAGAAGVAGAAGAADDDSDSSSGDDSTDEDDIMENPNGPIDPLAATDAAISAALDGGSSRKKKSGKKAPDTKKRNFKKKRGGGGGGIDFASI